MDDTPGKSRASIQEEHLSELTIWGITYVSTVSGPLQALMQEYKAESKPDISEQLSIIEMLIEVNSKHLQLLNRSIEERRQYFSSLENRD